MQGGAIDAAGHAVLRGDTLELHARSPSQDLFEVLTSKYDALGLASARRRQQCESQWRLGLLLVGVLCLLHPTDRCLILATRAHGTQETLLFWFRHLFILVWIHEPSQPRSVVRRRVLCVRMQMSHQNGPNKFRI